MALAGVYKLTDPETGVFYIGSTGDLEKRLQRHLDDLKADRHHSVRFQKHHGKSEKVNWVAEMVFIAEDRESAYALEDRFLKENADNPLMLNTSLSARGMSLRVGTKEHDEWRTNMTNSIVSKYESMSSEERKRKWGKPGALNGMFGKTHSEEVKRLSSEKNKGNSYAKGAVRGEAQRAKLSEMAKGRMGAKNPFFGRQHTEETRKRISQVKKANPQLPGNARKISIDGKVYESLMAAKRATGVSQALLIHRIKSNNVKYSGYHYVQ